MTATAWWIAVGCCGQALFGLRFFVQWLASERAQRSVMPRLFWYMSIPAGILVFLYAAWRQDPVFMTNEGLCVLICLRNIWVGPSEKPGSSSLSSPDANKIAMNSPP